MERAKITDREAKIAVNTIIEYCHQKCECKDETCLDCKKCAISNFCYEMYKQADDWSNFKNLKDYPVLVDENGKMY